MALNSTTIYGNLTVTGDIKGRRVYGAVYNDYAEFRKSAYSYSAGNVVEEDGKGNMILCKTNCSSLAHIVTDTYGMLIGDEENSIPIAVSGRVLVYYQDDKVQVGQVVCSDNSGKVRTMSLEEKRNYPECILGVVSEIPDYETWGEEPVKGRIWINLK